MKLSHYFPLFSGGENQKYLEQLKTRLLAEKSFDSYTLNPADHNEPGISRKSLWVLGRKLGFKMVDPYFNRVKTNQQPDIKQQKSVTIKKTWENPSIREQRTIQRNKTLENKDLRERIGEKTKIGMQQSGAAQKKSTAMKKRWQDSKYRELTLFLIRQSRENPKFHKKLSAAMKKLWETPEYRAKIVNGLRERGLGLKMAVPLGEYRYAGLHGYSKTPEEILITEEETEAFNKDIQIISDNLTLFSEQAPEDYLKLMDLLAIQDPNSVEQDELSLLIEQFKELIACIPSK
jgi:hypothetical protein